MKRYNIDYLPILFEFIDKIYDLDNQKYDKLKDKSLEFIFNLFSIKKVEDLRIDFIEILKESVDIVGQFRMLYKKDKIDYYSIYYDVFIGIMGINIIKEEENRSQKNAFFNMIDNFLENKSSTSIFKKALGKLGVISFHIENSGEECEKCKKIKKQIINQLEQIENLNNEKKGYEFLESQEEIINDNIKNYREHLKDRHKMFYFEGFNKKFLMPIFLLQMIVVLFMIFHFDEFIFDKLMLKRYGIDGEGRTFILALIFTVLMNLLAKVNNFLTKFFVLEKKDTF
ncbi:hypothetical protein U472_12505 [Orenia metallireducens]|uniref:Uncharacterized protein n=2 Tax=Orenia metallireducens TaxID=1413210 RepID=A0A1C0A4Y0_9FIRM|nr:hypothetical protein U472_12505 [Orenia metallireducens]